MEPVDPLRKATAVFRQEGSLESGRGKITGIVAFALAWSEWSMDSWPTDFAVSMTPSFCAAS